jgi:hypothetical protein
VVRSETFVPVAGAYLTETGELVIPDAEEQVEQAPKAPRDHVLDSMTQGVLDEQYALGHR